MTSLFMYSAGMHSLWRYDPEVYVFKCKLCKLQEEERLSKTLRMRLLRSEVYYTMYSCFVASQSYFLVVQQRIQKSLSEASRFFLVIIISTLISTFLNYTPSLSNRFYHFVRYTSSFLNSKTWESSGPVVNSVSVQVIIGFYNQFTLVQMFHQTPPTLLLDPSIQCCILW